MSDHATTSTLKTFAADKTLLLDLIDILESSKPEADKKLEKFEASLEEMLQE